MAVLEAEARRLPNRPRPKVVSTQGCPTTRPSVTSPIPSPHHSRAWRKDFLQANNCQAVVWRRGPPTRLRMSNRLRRRPSTTGAVPREVSGCWLLLGKGSREVCSGRGPGRAGADPPRPGCATRAPRSHTQPSGPKDRMRRKLQTRPINATLVLAKNCGAGIGQIKQGRGFRQFLAAGTGEGERRWSLSSTGHNQAQTGGSVLWGTNCTGKTLSKRPS